MVARQRHAVHGGGRKGLNMQTQVGPARFLGKGEAPGSSPGGSTSFLAALATRGDRNVPNMTRTDRKIGHGSGTDRSWYEPMTAHAWDYDSPALPRRKRRKPWRSAAFGRILAANKRSRMDRGSVRKSAQQTTNDGAPGHDR